MIYQRTVAKEISVTGLGLHSGKRVTLRLSPAPVDSGIVFKRSDLPHAKPIKTDPTTVSATTNATTIGQGLDAIHTVEHLLAACYGLGIDNLYCEVDGPEIPIMDGSSGPFVFIIKESGIVNLSEPKKFLVVTKPIEVSDGMSWARFEPSSKLVIDSTILFPHPIIREQKRIFEFSCDNYVNEICRARTFGFLKDFDNLKRMGLIKGGSLDNAIVLDDFKVVNKDGLRFKDEFIRHKILDTIGDISLLGYEIAAKVTTYKSGHKTHNMLCRKLLENKDAYEIVSARSLEREVVHAFELPQDISPVFQ